MRYTCRVALPICWFYRIAPRFPLISGRILTLRFVLLLLFPRRTRTKKSLTTITQGQSTTGEMALCGRVQASFIATLYDFELRVDSLLSTSLRCFNIIIYASWLRAEVGDSASVFVEAKLSESLTEVVM